MMNNNVLSQCKILVNSPKHWDPLRVYLNELLGVEYNRLVYAETFEAIKEIQGNIKSIKRILSLPEEVRRSDHK